MLSSKQMQALIAMSGGVDSSVAACLLQEQGYSCLGVTMKLFSNEDIGLSRAHSCCSLDDVEDARSVARRLEIPHYVFNFCDRFRETVIDKFVSAYENGCTPNPCIDCNRYLKFSKLFQRARELSCDYVATGHYARISYDAAGDRYLLHKARDVEKDQSYVLYMLTQQQLRQTLFPLGSLTKAEVRQIAARYGLINARKAESQDICFVNGGSYADFIRGYTGKAYPEGDFVDVTGRPLGRHRGIINYTIGQRRGLGISAPQPLYVCAIDPQRNTVTLGTADQLRQRRVTVGALNLIACPQLKGPQRLQVKLRYRQQEQWATVHQTGPDTLLIEFDAPQPAAARGQAAVLYDGDIVIGGGTIQ